MKKKPIRIWIPAYRPMMMGGDVNAPVCADVDGEPVNLGRGYKGFIVSTPSGGIVVAEARSGAIVGQSLKMVKEDIAKADAAVMRKQVKAAIEEGRKANILDAEQFWNYVAGATP